MAAAGKLLLLAAARTGVSLVADALPCDHAQMRATKGGDARADNSASFLHRCSLSSRSWSANTALLDVTCILAITACSSDAAEAVLRLTRRPKQPLPLAV
jgi:hypothetical protein